MGKYSKTFALILTLIIAISCLTILIVKPANAQSTTLPSVPQFTVKFVDLSYNVPTTTSIDQYNGQTITNQGYHVENRTIQLVIKNQPFTSFIQGGENISFYFNVREKGAYAENWTTLYNPNYYFPTASNTDYTTLIYVIDQNAPPFWDNLVNGGTVDFQVQALIGSVHRISNITGDNQLPWEMFPWVFDGQTSDWSNTQTITIPASSSLPSASPTVPELSWLALVPLIIAIPIVLFLIRQKSKGKRLKPYSIEIAVTCVCTK